MIVPLAVLTGAPASYWYFLRGNLQSRPVVARWLYAGTRGRFFALWSMRALMLFGAVAVIGVAMLGQVDAIAALPSEFASARAMVVDQVGNEQYLPIWPILLALLGGGVIGGIVDRFRRGKQPWMLGDVSRVMPRHRGELIWGVVLSVVAGTTEELFFRLLLPLAIASLTGQALLGFAVGIALFAGAHRYQGWLGVAATAVVGALLTVLYLMTGSLWTAMLVHVVIDLNGLVLRPIMAGVLSSSGAIRS